MSQKIAGKGSLALALSLALGLSGVARAEVRIGVAGPHTGPSAAIGEQYWRGASQAAADINAAGGINGQPIALIKGDDACEPKQAVAVANRLVDQDKVAGVIGHFCSSSTIPASAVYDEAGVLMITPGSTNPQVTDRHLNVVFRMCGRDDQQGQVAADFILDTLKGQRVAIIHDKDTYGQGIANAARARLNQRGVSEVLYEGLTRGEKDFNALVTKLKELGVEVLYFGGYHPEAGLILRQAAEKGLKARFMGPEGVGNKDISSIAGAASEGLLVTLPKRYDQEAANLKLAEALKANKQDPSGPFVWTSYAAVQALAAGIAKAGDDPAAVAKSLKSDKVPTVMGDLQWDEKGDLKGFEFGIFGWHKDGSSTVLK